MEATRLLVGKRARGVGKLRPSVVLYNEAHKDGEVVGEVVRKDLVGGSKGKGRGGADLLLVVGTSLRVPGTKRIVREFAKAVRSRTLASPNISGLPSPSPSPRRSPATDDEPPIKTAYLNLDFPVPTREWEGVFDVWLQGDAQSFAELLQQEITKEVKAKEGIREKKRKREEETALAALREKEAAKSKKKRKLVPEVVARTTKRRKVNPPRTNSKKKPRGKPIPSPEEQARPKLFLRIPARPKPPAVYIATPSPRKTIPAAHRVPPTPAHTPRSSRKTITRGKPLDKSSRSLSEQVAIDSGDESSELSDVPDELPSVFTY